MAQPRNGKRIVHRKAIALHVSRNVQARDRRVGPREAYITHMSHEIGLHAETEATLPPGVHLAYDGLEVEI